MKRTVVDRLVLAALFKKVEEGAARLALTLSAPQKADAISNLYNWTALNGELLDARTVDRAVAFAVSGLNEPAPDDADVSPTEDRSDAA